MVGEHGCAPPSMSFSAKFGTLVQKLMAYVGVPKIWEHWVSPACDRDGLTFGKHAHLIAVCQDVRARSAEKNWALDVPPFKVTLMSNVTGIS